ncbi:hypothetical protein C8J56DRAFT_1053091 [Mycena floridula]|nr:hypothetical protein C8J56DRAFT_1053091 [Mycena floridula]
MATISHMVQMEEVIDEDFLIPMFEDADPIKFQPPIPVAHIPGEIAPEAFISLTKPFPFDILGEGTVIKEFVEGGTTHQLSFENMIHTPNLTANLISIRKLDEAGFNITFGGGRGIVTSPTGSFAVRRNENRIGAPMVERLPFTRPIAPETLGSGDLVCIDLFGPSDVRSVGGAQYMMMVVDAGTKVKDAFFISNKESATMLAAFDSYQKQFETQTEHKIKHL